MLEPAAKAEPEPEPAREPKSKSKPAGGSALLAAFVKKHAPSEASKAVERNFFTSRVNRDTRSHKFQI